MALFNKQELEEIARQESLNESFQIKSFHNYFSDSLNDDEYDIFLSHSYNDKNAVLGLYKVLTKDYGFSVYIDWIADKQLNREHVKKETATTLRDRMKRCKCLLYVTSETASNSKWMPWETGFMDGFNGKVAICPLVSGSQTEYEGQEYLGIYPYISEGQIKGRSEIILWIKESTKKYVSFTKWLEGENPYIHN